MLKSEIAASAYTFCVSQRLVMLATEATRRPYKQTVAHSHIRIAEVA